MLSEAGSGLRVIDYILYHVNKTREVNTYEAGSLIYRHTLSSLFPGGALTIVNSLLVHQKMLSPFICLSPKNRLANSPSLS